MSRSAGDRTGRAPITVKWVDVLKAADGETFVRSRLVARDFKVKGEKDREDLFAATAPLELLRTMISKAATETKKGTLRKLLFIDAMPRKPTSTRSLIKMCISGCRRRRT